MKIKRKMGFFLLCMLSLLGVLFLIPVIMTLVHSFMNNGKITFGNYKILFFDCFPFYRMFWNSVMYSFSITVGTMLIAVPAAFALKFANFPGRHLVYFLYVILMMMPLQVMILPNYIGLRGLKLLNTPFAIIFPLLFSPFAVVVLYQYLRGCDNEIVDAARLETNSVMRILFSCILPQIRVCLFAVGLLTFSEAWNLVEQPLLYLDTDKWKNLSLLFSESDHYEKAVLFPAGVLFMIPVFLWYVVFRKELKNGLRL